MRHVFKRISCQCVFFPLSRIFNFYKISVQSQKALYKLQLIVYNTPKLTLAHFKEDLPMMRGKHLNLNGIKLSADEEITPRTRGFFDQHNYVISKDDGYITLQARPGSFAGYTKAETDAFLAMKRKEDGGEVSAVDIAKLVKKYKLADDSQKSLEKGLRTAAANNQNEDTQKFIKLVNNINSTDDNPEKGYTALHLAVFKSHIAIIKLLLEADALFWLSDAKWKSAKDYAVEIGNPDVLALFPDLVKKPGSTFRA